MSVKEELLKIHAAHGELRPEVIVLEATQADHPLHSYFTWDESEAAHRFRLIEAQTMIRQVKVIIELHPNTEPIQVRAFIAGEDCAAGQGLYRDVRDVITNDLYRTAWMQTMRRDWERLLRKYEVHKEFSDMVLGDLKKRAS